MKTKLTTICLALMVMLYTSCSEKEVPQPTENTARVDALRNELRNLQLLVYGEELENALLKAEEADLTAQIAELTAQVDALKAIYAKAVLYSVQVYDFQGKAIAGASVTLNQNGTISTVVADNNGVAVFEDVRAGYVAGVVSATGFATANYTVSLVNYGDNSTYTRVPLMPKGGNAQSDAGLFTVSGYVYANFNAANDTAGGFNNNWGNIANFKGIDAATKYPGPNSGNPHRTYDKVAKKIMVTVSFPTIQYIGSSGTGMATIQKLAYEDAVYTATYDANNMYSLKLPAYSEFAAGYLGTGTQWFFRYSFEEFTSNVTLIDNWNTGTVTDWYTSTNFRVPVDVKATNPKTYIRKYLFKVGSTTESTTSYGTTFQVLPGSTVQKNYFYEPVPGY